MRASGASRRSFRWANFIAVIGRVALCLCLWNSPLPLLHAHEGHARDEGSTLARHLTRCHSQRWCSCENWHVHLVLWGDVQSDNPENQEHDSEQFPVDSVLIAGVGGSLDVRGLQDSDVPWSISGIPAEILPHDRFVDIGLTRRTNSGSPPVSPHAAIISAIVIRC